VDPKISPTKDNFPPTLVGIYQGIAEYAYWKTALINLPVNPKDPLINSSLRAKRSNLSGLDICLQEIAASLALLAMTPETEDSWFKFFKRSDNDAAIFNSLIILIRLLRFARNDKK